MLRFENLQTPSEDGGILLEPPPREWPRLLEQNIRLAQRQVFSLAGVPAHEAWQRVRTQLLANKADSGIVAAGHQPEFVHPGVWAKHVAVRCFAGKAGLAGADFVVDNDSPRSTGLRIPVQDDEGFLAMREVGMATAPAGSAYEGRAPVAREQASVVRSQLAAALGPRFNESMMGVYLDGLVDWAGAGDFVDQHLAGRARIDTSLAADLSEYRVSQVVRGPFVADLLVNAERFAAAYNESLAEYRRQQHVRSPDRPLPDLQHADGRTETAWWAYRPLQRRRRLWIEPAGESIRFFADETPVGELGRSDLQRDPDATVDCLRPWVLRPRALTLTLWARLLACDLFVHGIGGAKYDRVTDGIIRRYYSCEPPAYVCVSATLRSGRPMLPATVQDLAVAGRCVRDWLFNPQRYCSDLPVELLEERTRLIDRSDELRRTQGPRTQRREIFAAIRAVNNRLAESRSQVASALIARRELLSRQIKSNEVAAGREFFYALQSRARLERLAGRFGEEF